MLVIDKFNCAFMPISKAGSSSLILSLAEEVYDEEYIQSQKTEHEGGYNGVLRK